MFSSPTFLFGLATLATFTSVLAPTLCLANDTSFPSIEVDAIETNAKVNTTMSFSGGQAQAFMAALPKINSVIGPKYDNHRRALSVKSPGYSITLFCTDMEIDFNTGGQTPITPSCDIHFEKRNDDINTFPFQPSAQCLPE